MMDKLATALLISVILAYVVVATACTRTVYVDKIIEVPVEVFLPCQVNIPNLLVYPLEALPPGQPDGLIILAMDEEIEDRAQMEARLRNLLITCKEMPRGRQ